MFLRLANTKRNVLPASCLVRLVQHNFSEAKGYYRETRIIKKNSEEHKNK